ncbi:MAG: hypothetical protein ACFE8E_13030 [Candidatus Hodarchaeota archaeon]
MTEQLAELEKVVLSIIQDYLNKNRVLDIDKVIPFIQTRLREKSKRLTTYGIQLILKSLQEKKLIVKASKLTYDTILNNKKRRKIHKFIKNYPGTHFSRIVSKLEISSHVVVWHLNILLKFGFIKKEKIENRDAYYTPDIDKQRFQQLHYIYKAKSQKIIYYLKENNIGISKTQISSDLNMHINTVNKYLKVLNNVDIITKEKLSNSVLFFLNEERVDNLL